MKEAGKSPGDSSQTTTHRGDPRAHPDRSKCCRSARTPFARLLRADVHGGRRRTKFAANSWRVPSCARSRRFSGGGALLALADTLVRRRRGAQSQGRAAHDDARRARRTSSPAFRTAMIATGVRTPRHVGRRTMAWQTRITRSRRRARRNRHADADGAGVNARTDSFLPPLPWGEGWGEGSGAVLSERDRMPELRRRAQVNWADSLRAPQRM